MDDPRTDDVAAGAAWPAPTPHLTASPAEPPESAGRPAWAWVAFAVAVLFAAPIVLYAAARSLFGVVGCSIEPDDCTGSTWAWFVFLSVASVAAPMIAIATIRSSRSVAVNAALAALMFLPAAAWWLTYT